jgi:hypothetical protein
MCHRQAVIQGCNCVHTDCSGAVLHLSDQAATGQFAARARSGSSNVRLIDIVVISTVDDRSAVRHPTLCVLKGTLGQQSGLGGRTDEQG